MFTRLLSVTGLLFSLTSLMAIAQETTLLADPAAVTLSRLFPADLPGSTFPNDLVRTTYFSQRPIRPVSQQNLRVPCRSQFLSGSEIDVMQGLNSQTAAALYFLFNWTCHIESPETLNSSLRWLQVTSMNAAYELLKRDAIHTEEQRRANNAIDALSETVRKLEERVRALEKERN